MKLVLDTNIYCDYAEGLVDAVDAIATYGQAIFIPSVVLGELFFGFMKGSRQRFNEKKLRQVVNRLKIEIIDVNTDVARKYALIYLTLQKKGVKIPINDVWIAACCIEIGGILLARIKRFELVDEIERILHRAELTVGDD